MHKLQISAELIPDAHNGGYTIYCPEFDVMSQGDDPDEALMNLKEAVRLAPLEAEGFLMGCATGAAPLSAA